MVPTRAAQSTLYYATLMGAAVHLNRMQPLRDRRKLLWYKVQTMQLANETLKVPAEGASDQMILVALILLYYNVSFTWEVGMAGEEMKS